MEESLARIEREIEQHHELTSVDSIQVVEMLEKVQDVLSTASQSAHCPVCQQSIDLADLRVDIEQRLNEMRRFRELAERRSAANADLIIAVRQVESSQSAFQDAARSVIQHANRDLLDSDPTLTSGLRERLEGFSPGPASANLTPDAIDEFQAFVDELVSFEEEANQQIGRLVAVGQMLRQLDESREHALTCSRVHSSLQKMHIIVRQKRLDVSKDILAAVADDCNRLYATLHPEEGLAISRIELDQKRRASVVQEAQFGEHHAVAPQAYFSEAHLDTLGFCLWLATVKRDNPNRDAVVVIDDVFSAVDAPHMARIAQLLVDERNNFAQILPPPINGAGEERC